MLRKQRFAYKLSWEVHRRNCLLARVVSGTVMKYDIEGGGVVLSQ